MRWNVAERDRDLAYQIAPNRVKLNQKIIKPRNKCSGNNGLSSGPTHCASVTCASRTMAEPAARVLASRQVGGNELVTGTALIQQTL